MDITKDITFHYTSKVDRRSDELTTVVKGHLLVEFVLNELIRRGLRDPKPLLDDHRSYTFAVKAQILYSARLLPPEIFRNIVRINKIRNQLAHNLQTDQLKIDYKFSRADDEVRGDVEVRDKVTHRRASRKWYIRMLCMGPLSQLRNFFYATYGDFPIPPEASAI
jgi:hypothetical protein